MSPSGSTPLLPLSSSLAAPLPADDHNTHCEAAIAHTHTHTRVHTHTTTQTQALFFPILPSSVGAFSFLAALSRRAWGSRCRTHTPHAARPQLVAAPRIRKRPRPCSRAGLLARYEDGASNRACGFVGSREVEKGTSSSLLSLQNRPRFRLAAPCAAALRARSCAPGPRDAPAVVVSARARFISARRREGERLLLPSPLEYRSKLKTHPFPPPAPSLHTTPPTALSTRHPGVLHHHTGAARHPERALPLSALSRPLPVAPTRRRRRRQACARAPPTERSSLERNQKAPSASERDRNRQRWRPRWRRAAAPPPTT